MANVGELSVLLKANTKQASQQLKGFGQGVSSSFASMKVGILAVGAAITAFATVSLKKFLDTGDQLHKMSLRTSIAVEELDKLRLVFELSGTSIDGFERGMMTLQRQLLAGAQGSKLSADAFGELGLEIETIQKMGARELFMAVAEGLAAIENDTKRSAIAMQLLGRFGTQMNSVLADGMQGFQDLSKEAEGLTYWTQESATKSAELNDSITLLKQSSSQLGFELANVLAPGLTKVADETTKTIQVLKKGDTESKDFWKTITTLGKTFGGQLSPAFLGAQKALEKFWVETETAEEKSERLGEIEDKLSGFLAISRDMTDNLKTARKELADKTNDATIANLGYSTSVINEIRQLESGMAVMQNATTEFEGHGEAVALSGEKYIELMKQVEDFIKTMQDAVDVTNDLNDALGLDMHGEMLDINKAAAAALAAAKRGESTKNKSEEKALEGKGGGSTGGTLVLGNMAQIAAEGQNLRDNGGNFDV